MWMKRENKIQQEKTALKQNTEYLQRQHSLKNRNIKYLSVVLCLLILYYFVSPMINGRFIKKAFEVIIGLVELWSFVIMLINICKLAQKKQ
jgi:hypothetical protein